MHSSSSLDPQCLSDLTTFLQRVGTSAKVMMSEEMVEKIGDRFKLRLDSQFYSFHEVFDPEIDNNLKVHLW